MSLKDTSEVMARCYALLSSDNKGYSRITY